MALVHDIAEAIVGDYTPYDAISKAEKSNLEREAMAKIRETLAGYAAGE